MGQGTFSESVVEEAALAWWEATTNTVLQQAESLSEMWTERP